MPRFTVTRGLPGSGKTTWAKAQKDAWRINRDDLRAMCNTSWHHGYVPGEQRITTMQYALIKLLLEDGVQHLIVDDMNMDWQHVQALIDTARSVGSLQSPLIVEVKEFLHVPLELCIERDAKRPEPVGADVITAMHRKYMGD